MGFATIADIVAETITLSKRGLFTFRKAPVAGVQDVWAGELFTGTGEPAAGSWTGTAGVATSLTSSSTGAMPLNAAVSTDTRHLLNLIATVTTNVPSVLYLVDFLLYYPSVVINTTETVLDNTVTLPRYTNGVGVQCIVASQSTIGATEINLTLSYTDTTGATGNTGLLTNGAQASVMDAGALFQNVTGLNTNVGNFLPWAAGDLGIKKIDSYSSSASTTGKAVFILLKVLATIPLFGSDVAEEKNFAFPFMSLPQIVDGACLGFIFSGMNDVATAHVFRGVGEYGWG